MVNNRFGRLGHGVCQKIKGTGLNAVINAAMHRIASILMQKTILIERCHDSGFGEVG
jgi:hypothetical protein